MNEEETTNQKVTNSENDSTLREKNPSDGEIKSRIEYTLLLDPLIESDTIDIDVSNRQVSLKGFVDAFWKKRKAKILSTHTKGVISVADELDIIPSREYPDEEIAHELEKAIDCKPVVSQEDVEVKVSNGEVTLEGTVPNWFTYSQIKICSENTPGVLSIVDKMKIES
jgi:hyperosmotically inducible protein